SNEAGALTQAPALFFKALKNKKYFLGTGIAMSLSTDRLPTVRQPREEHEPSRPPAIVTRSRDRSTSGAGQPRQPRADLRPVQPDVHPAEQLLQHARSAGERAQGPTGPGQRPAHAGAGREGASGAA